MTPPKFLTRLRACLPWLALLLVAGCATYPMGLNKAQWEALTPTQQAEYRAKQYAIDQERARLRAAEEARRAQAQREAEERERARVADAYRHARYGDVITVTVRDGSIAFQGKQHPYEPAAFDLVRGETKPVTFRRKGQPHIVTDIVMRLSEDGNTFYFDAPARKRFVAVNEGWNRGRDYSPEETGERSGQPTAVGVRISIKLRAIGPVMHTFPMTDPALR